MATCKGCFHYNVCYKKPIRSVNEDLVVIGGCFDYKPTADVVEVRHGEWLDNYEKITTLGGNGVPKEYLCGYKCSLCGRIEIKREPYCNCGAKMDGGKNEPTK